MSLIDQPARSWVAVKTPNPRKVDHQTSGGTMVTGRRLCPLFLTLALLACQHSSGFWIVNVVFPPNARPQQAPSNSTPPVAIGMSEEQLLLQSKNDENRFVAPFIVALSDAPWGPCSKRSPNVIHNLSSWGGVTSQSEKI